jgi:hypothetical protein
MVRLACAFVVVVLVCSPVTAQKAPCPPHRAGAAYPWEISQMMEGDHWADVAVDLDAHGKVSGCRIVRGNLESDEGFYVCRAVLAQGEFDPVMKDGAMIAGSRETHFVLHGMRHEDANEAAKKKWLAAHPQERLSCYPE